MNAPEQNFPAILFIMLCLQDGSGFSLCGLNPEVRPFTL